MTLRVFLGGVVDPTSQVLVGIWPDIIGDYVVTVGGQVQTLTVSDVSDYQGCTWSSVFSGLSGEVAYSVIGPDGSMSAVAHLVPASGAHLSVIFSCTNDNFWFDVSLPAMLTRAPHQILSLGDFPYCDNQRQVTTTPTVATIRSQLRRQITARYTQDLLQSAAWTAAMSDHDVLAGNDAPGRDDIAGANAFAGDASVNYYARLHALPDVINVAGEASSSYKGWPSADPVAAWEQFMGDGLALFEQTHRRPTNPDIGQTFGGGPVPSGATYTRWTVGRCEYFLADQFTFCDYTNDIATNRTMLGAVQLAWLLASIAASLSPFKVLLFPQLLLKSGAYANTAAGARNDYGHSAFSAEAETIKDALTDFTGWAAPGGVVIFDGDVHTPQVHWMTRGEGLLQLTGCPSGTGYITAPTGTGTSPDTVMLDWLSYSTDPTQRYFAEVDDAGVGPLACRIRDSHGKVRYEALISAGSNAPGYRPRAVA